MANRDLDRRAPPPLSRQNSKQGAHDLVINITTNVSIAHFVFRFNQSYLLSVEPHQAGSTVKIFQSEDGNFLKVEVLGAHLDGDHMVSIFNLNGQLLLKQNTNNQNRFTLDTKNQLQNGAYVLGINGPSGNYLKKFMFVN